MTRLATDRGGHPVLRAHDAQPSEPHAAPRARHESRIVSDPSNGFPMLVARRLGREPIADARDLSDERRSLAVGGITSPPTRRPPRLPRISPARGGRGAASLTLEQAAERLGVSVRDVLDALAQHAPAVMLRADVVERLVEHVGERE